MRLKATIILLLALVLSLGATNAIGNSKGTMTDATGGWWRIATSNYSTMVVTIDYTKGDSTNLKITAGVRYTNEAGLVSTITYIVPIVDSYGYATATPVTMESTGSYTYTVNIPAAADQLYVKVELTGGTTAVVDINAAPDKAF